MGAPSNNSFSGYKTGKDILGTTTDDYVVAYTVNCAAFRSGTIIIKNTHAANVLTYKIDGKVAAGGNFTIADVAAADIAGTAQIVYERTLGKGRAELIISVKSKVSGTPAGYNIEFYQGQ